MNRLEVEHTTEDELRRQIERSVERAVESRLGEVRRSMERFFQKAYLQKTWLTLDEAAQYADITKATLRDWREEGLSEAKVQGRVYIKREALDRFIASHAEGK
jgi:excisionase family DNA binding protein